MYCTQNVPLLTKHIKGVSTIFLDTNNIQEIYKHIQSYLNSFHNINCEGLVPKLCPNVTYSCFALYPCAFSPSPSPPSFTSPPSGCLQIPNIYQESACRQMWWQESVSHHGYKY